MTGFPARRVFLGSRAGLAVGLAALLAVGGSIDPARGVPAAAAPFLAPPADARPWVRWNLAPGATLPEMRRELQQIRDAGIAGVELGQAAIYPAPGLLGPLLDAANGLGLKVTLFDGPINAPAGFSINDDQARKLLVFGEALATTASPFAGMLPIAGKVGRKSLVAVQAYRCIGTCTAGQQATLDRDSRIDLTGQVFATAHGGIAGAISDGQLIWTPPGPGQWVVLALWSAGYLAQPDLLTSAGLQVLTGSINRFLTPVAEALRRNGGDFFFDSHSTWRGDPIDTWSNTMAADFQAATGYSIVPYLPLLVRQPITGWQPTELAFRFDPDTTRRFHNDFDQVRTDLWLQRQIGPLQDWARRYNRQIVLQPYGDNVESIDMIQAAATADKPETETLWFGDEVDNYLPLASANHMLHRSWYSLEGSAVADGAYAQGLQDQLVHVSRAFAGGVTRLIYHIYPYEIAADAHWPGYSMFPDSFGNSWGPRDPDWVDARAFNDGLARLQGVLSRGEGKVDVAVYLQSYLWPQPYTRGGLQYWPDPSLARAGYTRDYLDNALLSLPAARVSSGRLATDGPAYQALIVDGTQQPAEAASRDSMPLAVARRLLDFASAGLPIVIVGHPPNTLPGLNAATLPALRQTLARLMADPHTHVVASEAEVPALLERIGVVPAARPAEPSPILSIHRQEPDVDFYWLFNQGPPVIPSEPATLLAPATHSSTHARFTLAGSGQPCILDPWTGGIVPLAEYTTVVGGVTIPLDLVQGASTVIVLTDQPARYGCARLPVHAVATTADIVAADGGTLLVGATRAGSYQTKLGDGRTIRTDIAAGATTLDLTRQRWVLDAQDWQPAYPFATMGAAAIQTRQIPVHVVLDSLKAWPDIPALADASGIGTYTTAVTLPTTWSRTDRATLSLGQVFDSFTIAVNGRPVPFTDQIAASAEIGAMLQPGRNTIAVRVATTLNNRLRNVNPALAGRPRQPYGLVGPVLLTPYTMARLSAH